MPEAFVETVLKRRLKFRSLEDVAVRAMQDDLQQITDDAKDALQRLKNFINKEGRYETSPEAVTAARARIKELQETIKEVEKLATNKLIESRQTAYTQGVADVQYSLDKSIEGTDYTIKGSFSDVFDQAAKKAKTGEVLGVKPSDALKGISRWNENKIRSIISSGVMNGEPALTVAKRIEQVGGVTQRAASRIARTNLNAAMNEAHVDAIKENDDIFSGFKWSAIMDERTSLICAELDGRVFDLDEEPPGPPAHPNCRSILIGVFKDPEMQKFAESGEKRVRDLLASGERNKQTSLIDSDTSFEDWLRDQPAEASARLTGSKLKDSMWRSGQVEFKDLLKPDLTPRSEEDLIQIALANDPKNKELQSLAKERGVDKRSAVSIQRADKRLANQQSFDQGEMDD